MRYGPSAGANPWDARGLEWATASPPPTDNFDHKPRVSQPAYAYDEEEQKVG